MPCLSRGAFLVSHAAALTRLELQSFRALFRSISTPCCFLRSDLQVATVSCVSCTRIVINANKFAVLRIESLWAVAHGQAQLSWSQMAGARLAIASGIAYGKALEASKRESKMIGDSEDTPILQSIAHRTLVAVI